MIEKRVGKRVQDNFWDNTMPIPECGCLLWTRKINPNGYGALRFKGKQVLAHRIAWELINGDVPNGNQILHRCDVKSCINPYHLFLGSQQDNMNDMKKKGRSTRGKRFFEPKLTDSDVSFIRFSKATCFELAKIFGISFQHVSDIKRFKRYMPGVKTQI